MQESNLQDSSLVLQETQVQETQVQETQVQEILDQIIYIQKAQFFCDVSLVVLMLVLILGVGWRDWKH